MTTVESGKPRLDLRHVKLPSAWEVTIALLVFYAFFFQYAVRTVSFMMLGLNALCILFAFTHILIKGIEKRKTFYWLIILFVFSSVLIGFVFGVSSRATISTGIRMIEYALTGFSVYLFIATHKQCFDRIVLYTWLSVFLLAITVIRKGTVVDYMGALGLGPLNTNEMSSYFVMMVFCTFLLYRKAEYKLQRVIIWASLIICFFVQIQSASRRGFVVMTFMIVLNILYTVIPFNNENYPRKKLILYSILIMIGAAAFVGLQDYILNNTILGARLSGNMISGDRARTIYHKFAYEQFSKHPIFGVGIGGINYLMGVYSHSLFYETLACTGIVGSCILLGAFIEPLQLTAKRVLSKKKGDTNKNSMYIYKTILIYLLAILISGIAVVMIYDFYFYFSLGLIAGGIRVAQDSTIKHPKAGGN